MGNTIVVSSITGADSLTGPKVNIDFDPGETYEIDFDFDLEEFGTGIPVGDDGLYTIPTSVSLGTISNIDTAAGTFTWTITQAEWVAASTPGSVFFQVENSTTITGPLLTGAITITCFLKGSEIETNRGAVPVENLSIGDLVLNDAGQDVKVKWIGRQTLSKFRHGAHMQPVCIKAGALGGGLPISDLTVTADHGMVIDGYVINAAALVNGDTIDFVPMSELNDTFTVYHIETEAHDVILANGAPSETFVDVAGRRSFDNYREYLDLYGTERIISEMPMHRITSARLVPLAIKDRLRTLTHAA